MRSEERGVRSEISKSVAIYNKSRLTQFSLLTPLSSLL